jgi:segregation and condensation protein A
VSTAPHTFAIKTEVFEGPLDLLIDLVEKRKLLINDISLAAVTDEYLAHVSRMQERSLAGTANFIQLAATLLLIKSKSLLPVLELSEEEQGTIDDLEERLRLYQIYRTAAKAISEVFGVRVMHGRGYAPRVKPIFAPDAYATVPELNAAIGRVIAELPKEERKPKVALKNVMSLEEMIDRLHARIESSFRLRFSDLIGPEKERTTVIVGFLAILESVKQGRVLVAQAGRFSDIEIEHGGVSAPRYG